MNLKEYIKETIHSALATDTSIPITESAMSELDILAQEAKDLKSFIKTVYKEFKNLPKNRESLKWLEDIYNSSVNESVNEASADAYTLHRLADNPGQEVAGEFLSKHNVDIKLLAKAIQQKTISKYELRDIVNGTAQSSKMKKFIKDFVKESVNENDSYSITDDKGRHFLLIVGEEPKDSKGKSEYKKDGFYISPQKGFKGLITAYFKDEKTLKKNIDKKYHNQLGESMNEAKSMDMNKRLKVYDKLKKGDEITIKYGSSMSSGNEAKFKVTKGKTLVGKQKVERIILQNVANPKGVKYYLYQRNGNVTMAIGNMAASIEDMSESVVTEGTEPQIKKIAQLTGARVSAVETYVSSRALNITKLLKYLKDEKYKGAMDFIKAVLGDKKQDAYFIKMFKESVNESLNHNDMYTMLDIAAGYSSTQDQAANQMWSDEQDLYDYLKSDHIPKKYHKKFYNDIKRRFKGVNESINEAKEPEVITQLRKIVKDSQNDLIKDTKSGKKVRVDMNSANLMIQVYDALKKQSNKDKFVKSGIVMMGHTAFKLMKNEGVNEGDGLWANIRAKKARGEKPAHKNSKAYKDAVKAGKKINKNESVVNEAKDNLYLQLHKKYAEQIKGLKANKIKKLSDLVWVQRRSMSDRDDYFDMDSKKKKELSAEYRIERNLLKKYMARDYSVMLPKGTEKLPESVNEGKYYITRNLGRGQGKALVKQFDKKTFTTLDKPIEFKSYKDAQKEVDRLYDIGKGSHNMTAYIVTDKKMNPLTENQIDEKLITFSNRAPYGQIVFMAGGAGSGKGFAIDNFIDSAGFKVRDVDEMKKAVGKLDQLGKFSVDKWYKKYGKKLSDKPGKSGGLSPKAHVEEFVLGKGMSISDISKDLKNPNNVASLHYIVDSMGLKDKWLISMLSGKTNKETLPNLLFDITAKKVESITEVIKPLLDNGYDAKNVHLIWVLANFHVAIKANKERDRMVPEDILLQTHEGASQTMWEIMTKILPKGLNGRIDVILNKRAETVPYVDSNGKPIMVQPNQKNKLKDAQIVVKGFTSLPIKKQGGGVQPEKAWKEILKKWILDNAPKTIDLSQNLGESVNEVKDNLYLQLHKKYAEQIKGLKAKKIKKLSDLVWVQRRSMSDRGDYFDMDSKKKKELSAEYRIERNLLKKYMARDYSVMLPKGTEKLPESVNEANDTYFKTAGEAVDFAKTKAEKKGYEIDEDDWNNQITHGGRYSRLRPSVGKTHTFQIGLLKKGKPQRKGLSISLFGMDSGNYELTYYIN